MRMCADTSRTGKAKRMAVRGLRLVGAVGIGLLLAVGFTPLVNVVSYWMAPSRALAPAPAIVVLGGGGVNDRGELNGASLFGLMEGVDLYRRGLAPLLLVSGSPSGTHGTEVERRAGGRGRVGGPGAGEPHHTPLSAPPRT